MKANPNLEQHVNKDINVPLWGWPKGKYSIIFVSQLSLTRAYDDQILSSDKLGTLS
jgi:hypothetical protein